MTAPRQVKPGRTLMVTVRAFRRFFFFAPSAAVNHLIEFVVAYAAAKHEVGLVAMTWMANHGHLLINDRLGCAPDFVQTMNTMLARGLNAYRREHGGVFERNNVDLKVVGSRKDLLTALAYIGANPVAAACVEHGRNWPGPRSQPHQMGHTEIRVTRPDFLFKKKHQGYEGDLPDAVTLSYELPLDVRDDERGQFVHDAETALSLAEAKARDDVRSAGGEFQGTARCRNLDHRIQATTWEPHGVGTKPSPFLIHEKKVHDQQVEWLKAFLEAYASAFRRWRNGDRDIEFPIGTWRMARCFKVRVVGSAAAVDPEAPLVP